MSLSKKIRIQIVGGLLLVCTVARADALTGRPQVHQGKPLRHFDVLEGPLSREDYIMPENGRFVIPQRPGAMSKTLPPFISACFYQGITDAVTVVLPENIRVCEFHEGPHIECR
jgi:hypothetical protein